MKVVRTSSYGCSVCSMYVCMYCTVQYMTSLFPNAKRWQSKRLGLLGALGLSHPEPWTLFVRPPPKIPSIVPEQIHSGKSKLPWIRATEDRVRYALRISNMKQSYPSALPYALGTPAADWDFWHRRYGWMVLHPILLLENLNTWKLTTPTERSGTGSSWRSMRYLDSWGAPRELPSSIHPKYESVILWIFHHTFDLYVHIHRLVYILVMCVHSLYFDFLMTSFDVWLLIWCISMLLQLQLSSSRFCSIARVILFSSHKEDDTFGRSVAHSRKSTCSLFPIVSSQSCAIKRQPKRNHFFHALAFSGLTRVWNCRCSGWQP